MTNTSQTLKGNKSSLPPAQLFLPFAEIRDNLVVLKTGGIRAILKVSSVNFSLKSEQEQNALVYAYQRFLNTLDFPVQIIVRSKKLDIDNYVDSFEVIARDQANPLIKKLTLEYMQYVKKLVEYADIMEKQFYVVVPYDPIRAQERGMIGIFLDAIHPKDNIAKIKQRHYEFDSLKKSISPRIESIHTSLNSCGLSVTQLDTPQLVELLYQSFNPVESRGQKVEDISKETLVSV